MNGGGSWSNFFLNVFEQAVELASRSPDLNNIRQAMEQLTGQQWHVGPRESSSEDAASGVSRHSERNHAPSNANQCGDDTNDEEYNDAGQLNDTANISLPRIDNSVDDGDDPR